MNRLRGVLVGVAIAAALLAGSFLSTDDGDGDGGPAPSAAPGPGELALDGYCRATYGDRAAGYAPEAVEDWACSAWTNGVWRLVLVDLADVCRWQAGPSARLGGGTPTERSITCTT